MRLAQIHATLAPYLEGRTDGETTSRRLWGEDARDDARRLVIYAHAARGHRRAAVDGVFSWTRAAIGEKSWSAHVEDYFRAAPMRHVELRENGAALPSFLEGRAAAWIAELADLEWRLWRAEVALEEDDDDGPLHVASTFTIRAYAHDVIAHVRGKAAPPPHRDIVAVFWRDRDLDGRMDYMTTEGLRVLERVRAGEPVASSETLDAYRSEGVVRGKPTEPSPRMP